MPTTSTRNEQVIEAVVSGPGGANRLFTVTGQAVTEMNVGPAATSSSADVVVETFTFLIGPTLSAGQFRRATASASFASHTVMTDAVPGNYSIDFLSVEADWDDESGRTEMRVEIRAQAGTNTRLQTGLIGFSATVLAELPTT